MLNLTERGPNQYTKKATKIKILPGFPVRVRSPSKQKKTGKECAQPSHVLFGWEIFLQRQAPRPNIGVIMSVRII